MTNCRARPGWPPYCTDMTGIMAFFEKLFRATSDGLQQAGYPSTTTGLPTSTRDQPFYHVRPDPSANPGSEAVWGDATPQPGDDARSSGSRPEQHRP